MFDIKEVELYKTEFQKRDIDAYHVVRGLRNTAAIYDLKTCFLILISQKPIWISKDIKWFLGGTQRAEALHLWDLKRHIVYSFVRSRKFNKFAKCHYKKNREKIKERKDLYESCVVQRKT